MEVDKNITEPNGSVSGSQPSDQNLPKKSLTICMNTDLMASDKYSPKESRRMLKNVVVVSLGFLLLFTAFNSISNLQSSINPQVSDW